MNAYPDGVENFRYYIVVTTNYFKITNVDVNFPGIMQFTEFGGRFPK